MSEIVKINGRRYFIAGIESVTKISPSRYRIVTRQGEFLAIGGKRSGGAANEWYVSQENGDNLIKGDIQRNSLVACARVIAQI